MALGTGGRRDLGGWEFRPIASTDTPSLVPSYEELDMPSQGCGRKELAQLSQEGLHARHSQGRGLGIMPQLPSLSLGVKLSSSPVLYGVFISYWGN